MPRENFIDRNERNVKLRQYFVTQYIHKLSQIAQALNERVPHILYVVLLFNDHMVKVIDNNKI